MLYHVSDYYQKGEQATIISKIYDKTLKIRTFRRVSEGRYMMVEQLAGTKIYLKPSLSQALSSIAQQEAKTVVYLVEELLEKAIRRKQQAQEPKQIRLAALERIKQHRAEILVERKGNPLQINLAAILEEVREERDDELFAS